MRGQVTASAAEIYDQLYVPALFGAWADRALDACKVRGGQRVLDVACGTGVVARAALERVGPSGSVAGVDINKGMLAVARRRAPEVEWRQDPAENLPFRADCFDAVICQFGLMFFENRTRAIEEMMRVLRLDGALAVVVWDTLEHTPGYAAVTKLLDNLFGEAIGDSMRVPYNLGDPEAIHALFRDAGVREIEVTTHEGTARFPSLRSWVETDVRGWTAADLIDDAGFARLFEAAERDLNPFVGADGTVSFAAPAHIVTTRKP